MNSKMKVDTYAKKIYLLTKNNQILKDCCDNFDVMLQCKVWCLSPACQQYENGPNFGT